MLTADRTSWPHEPDRLNLSQMKHCLHHWSEQQALTSAFCNLILITLLVLVNGGLYSYAFPQTLFYDDALVGLYQPVNLTGIVAFLLAFVILSLVYNPLQRQLNGTGKTLLIASLYAFFGFLLLFQYVFLIPSTCLLITAVLKYADAISD